MLRKMMVMAFVMASCVSMAEMVPSDMSLAMFISGRVQEPTVFKVKIAVTPWDGCYTGAFNGKFSEDECRNLFWAIKLRPFRYRDDHGLMPPITCYVKKSSKAGAIVKDALKDGGYHAALVQMRYSSDQQMNTCCMVDEIEILAAESPDITVKFSGTRLGVVKSKGYDYIQGTITANVRSKLKFFKKPVLRVVLLTEENGSRVIRDIIVNEPNIKMMEASDTLSHFTTTEGNSQNESWALKYIEELSANQSEVSKAQYAKVSYVGIPLGGHWGHGVKGAKWRNMFGFSKFDKDENAKMVGYRLEMWQKGECVAVYDTISASAIKRLQLPEDWHISFKYPDKFKYRSPFERKHVVRQ